jgi:hypothetical protein
MEPDSNGRPRRAGHSLTGGKRHHWLYWRLLRVRVRAWYDRGLLRTPVSRVKILRAGNGSETSSALTPLPESCLRHG